MRFDVFWILGPGWLFARTGTYLMDRDTRRAKARQQYGSHRGRHYDSHSKRISEPLAFVDAHFCGAASRTPLCHAENPSITFISELKKQIRNGLVRLGEGQSAVSDRADSVVGITRWRAVR